jgi:hypothetical protein
MLTKTELDDIWETKPYGYFAKYVKDTKGKKRYSVKTTAYRVTVTEEILAEKETLVLAKNPDEALRSTQLNNTQLGIKQQLGLSTWDNTLRFKNIIVRTP